MPSAIDLVHTLCTLDWSTGFSRWVSDYILNNDLSIESLQLLSVPPEGRPFNTSDIMDWVYFSLLCEQMFSAPGIRLPSVLRWVSLLTQLNTEAKGGVGWAVLMGPDMVILFLFHCAWGRYTNVWVRRRLNTLQNYKTHLLFIWYRGNQRPTNQDHILWLLSTWRYSQVH